MNPTAYAKSLLDPFDTSVLQPKLLDGKLDRSSGIRLRQTGEFTCPLDGTALYVVLSPGYANNLSHQNGDAGFNSTPHFTSHFENTTNRDLVNSIRVVSSGVKLTLVNSADESEGYWEAIRVPQATPILSSATFGNRIVYGAGTIVNLFADAANNPTYQHGKVRDLHRYLFRLNTRGGEHNFNRETTNATENGLLDRNWDTIIIKITGRVDAAQPTVLRFDGVSCQEVEYKPGTMLSRLMTYSTKLPNFDALLKKLNFQQPAIKLF